MIKPIFKKAEVYEKTWGRELWIHNSEKYCGKILDFKKNCYFSSHFHLKKEETWYVLTGSLILEYFDLETAEKLERTISEGDVIHIVPGVIHKLTASCDSKIMEVSTEHFENDSYRIEKSIEKQK
jgi:quercetin dioxygenase-like cupin family protein